MIPTDFFDDIEDNTKIIDEAINLFEDKTN